MPVNESHKRNDEVRGGSEGKDDAWLWPTLPRSRPASLSLFRPTFNLALTMSDTIEESLASLKLKTNLQCFV